MNSGAKYKTTKQSNPQGNKNIPTTVNQFYHEVSDSFIIFKARAVLVNEHDGVQ